MGYFRIVFDDNQWNGRTRFPIYVKHWNGSQKLFAEIEDLIGFKENLWGYPICIEIDGWGDDIAYPDCTYETDEGFTVECITEEEYNENI